MSRQKQLKAVAHTKADAVTKKERRLPIIFTDLAASVVGAA